MSFDQLTKVGTSLQSEVVEHMLRAHTDLQLSRKALDDQFRKLVPQILSDVENKDSRERLHMNLNLKYDEDVFGYLTFSFGMELKSVSSVYGLDLSDNTDFYSRTYPALADVANVAGFKDIRISTYFGNFTVHVTTNVIFKN